MRLHVVIVTLPSICTRQNVTFAAARHANINTYLKSFSRLYFYLGFFLVKKQIVIIEDLPAKTTDESITADHLLIVKTVAEIFAHNR